MMRQNIFENTKRQTPKMTFVYVLKARKIGLFFDRIETLLSQALKLRI